MADSAIDRVKVQIDDTMQTTQRIWRDLDSCLESLEKLSTQYLRIVKEDEGRYGSIADLASAFFNQFYFHRRASRSNMEAFKEFVRSHKQQG